MLVDLERAISKAVDMAWEGFIVTLEHEVAGARLYRRMRAYQSFGEDGLPLAEPNTPAGDRYCVQERIYRDGVVAIRHHWDVPPHVTLS